MIDPEIIEAVAQAGFEHIQDKSWEDIPVDQARQIKECWRRAALRLEQYKDDRFDSVKANWGELRLPVFLTAMKTGRDFRRPPSSSGRVRQVS